MDGHQEAALPGYPKVLVQLHYEKQNSKSQKDCMCHIQWLLLKEALETMLWNKQLWEENLNVRAEKGKAELVITAWLWIK